MRICSHSRPDTGTTVLPRRSEVLDSDLVDLLEGALARRFVRSPPQ